LGVLPSTNWSCLALLFSAGQLFEFLLRSHLSHTKQTRMVAEDMVVPMKKCENMGMPPLHVPFWVSKWWFSSGSLKFAAESGLFSIV
jgi:hypothetical protein